MPIMAREIFNEFMYVTAIKVGRVGGVIVWLNKKCSLIQ